MSIISLCGCCPEPLAAYLRSLAVLRLVCEQKDSGAKGWWESNIFHLDSSLNEKGLIDFFLNEYIPTPIVAPWNGGSGFYEGDNIEGREAIRRSKSPRFAEYRMVLEEILKWEELPLAGLSIGELFDRIEHELSLKRGKEKERLERLLTETRSAIGAISADVSNPLQLSIEELEKNATVIGAKKRFSSAVSHTKKLRTEVKKLKRSAGKEKIVQACRDRLSDHTIEWIDSAAILGPEGKVSYPPLLGTGGCEGRLDYTNTFMSAISALLLEEKMQSSSMELLNNVLFGEVTAGLEILPGGQHDPGRAGGYNQGAGVENKNFPVNPWSFVLAMEGTLAWAPSVARRQGAGGPLISSPFTVRPRAVGHTSLATADEKTARAEIWTPLWPYPTGYAELRAFLAEGRADIGGGRKRAVNTIQFAEAASSLGIDRGVREFVRYSLIKRRGDNYVALPAGRFPVSVRSESDLIRELDLILDKVDRFSREFRPEPPAHLTSARRNIDTAIYEVLLHGGPSRIKRLVAAIGNLEQILSMRDPSSKPQLAFPLAGLSPRWIAGSDDGCIEVRIAASIASIASCGDMGPIRANLSPVDPQKPHTWASGKGQVAWSGNSFAARMANVLFRRMMDATRLNAPHNPLYGSLRLVPEDVAGFASGELDEVLLENLLFGFMWIQWKDRSTTKTVCQDLGKRWSMPVRKERISRSWALLKLLHLSTPLKLKSDAEVQLRSEPSIIPLLLAGRIGEACRIAQRRLQVAGIAPVKSQFPDNEDGTRLAASLLLPVSRQLQIAELVLFPNKKN